MSEKATTLRLSSWQHLALKTLAEAQGQSIAACCREAIDAYIEKCRDPLFMERVRRSIEENNEVLEMLAKGFDEKESTPHA